MQAQTSRGNFAGYRRAYVVDGQDATLILKGKKKGATGGGLKPSAVVIGRIVVTDRSVVAANRNVEVVAEGVGKQHALDIHPENVVVASLEDDLAEELELISYIRSHKQVDLTEAES